jgi:SH3-like domain-containing protein
MKICRRTTGQPGCTPGRTGLEVLWILAPALVLIVLLVASPLAWRAGKKTKKAKGLWTVQVREAQVREEPSYLSPVVFRAGYTSRVRVVDDRDEWRRIEVPDRQDLTGWLLASALIEKQIVLQAPNKKTAKKLAQKKEQSLAGRSFQDEVEKKLRGKEKKEVAAGYARLDGMVAAVDAVAPVPGQIALFRAQGGLTPLNDPDGNPVTVSVRARDRAEEVAR